VGLLSKYGSISVVLLALGCGTALCQTTSAAPDTSPATSQTTPSTSKTNPVATPKTNAQSTAQPATAGKPAKTSPAKPETKAKPPLDATQKQAVSLLQAVQSDLGRYSPEMQTYLLQEMARAYKDLDRAKQVALLKEAFQSAANMPDTKYRTEQQRATVEALNIADPAALLSMQYSPDPQVREVVLKLLVQQDMDRGRLLDAAKRLSQWDTSLAFPYSEAAHLINKLTAQQSGERQAVFSSAVAAYRNSTNGPDNEFSDPMPDLILETYTVLPPAMVVDAIDLMLDKAAKQQASDQEQQQHASISVGGKNGQANFSSVYDFELFELLPVLDKVDPAKADALRRDHATVAALNNKYPDGRSSLSSDSAGMNMMVGMSGAQDPAPAGPDPAFLQQRQMADTIVESAAKDVDAAIANAQTLANAPHSDYAISTPRCQALEKIAAMEVGRKNFPAAITATKALANAAQDLPAMARAKYMVRAAAFSAQANDPQGARQYVSKAAKAADDLYQTDAFADPANEAPKSMWPSTAAWKGTFIVAEHLDPGFAIQEAASLPDPEIEAAANVAIASAMLNQEPGMTMLAVWQKGEPVIEMFFDIPWWSAGSSSPSKGGGGIEKAQVAQ
jgi:hypothetical protein